MQPTSGLDRAWHGPSNQFVVLQRKKSKKKQNINPHLPLRLSDSLFPFPLSLTMPENLLFFDDNGDDGFGDFKFTAATSPLPPSLFRGTTPLPLPPKEDDWGDFVISSSESNASFKNWLLPFDAFPDASSPAPIALPHDPPPTGKAWEKVRGAIPLSIFGDEEVEEPEPL